MSKDIHPNWHTTDDEEIVPVRAAPKKEEVQEIPVQTTSVSRRPAAIVGILLVVGITTLFYRGVQNLTGQLTGSQEIRITDAGFEPQDISAAPGQELSWINERQVPQYIISDTLCDATGECLNTQTMFQDDSSSYTIPTGTADGTYTYFSPTDPNLTGTITVGRSAPPADVSTPPTSDSLDLLPDVGDGKSVDAFTFTQQSLLESIQRQLALDEESDLEEEDSVPDAPATTQSGLPQNPYTVGSEREFPFDSDGNPISSAFGDYDSPPVASVTDDAPPAFAQNVQKPFRQPETGPGVWLVLTLSALGLWTVARKASPVIRIR